MKGWCSSSIYRCLPSEVLKISGPFTSSSGQNGVEKRRCSDWLQILLKQNIYAVFVKQDEKALEFNLGTAFAHLRNAEVCRWKPSRTSWIANWLGWIEKAWWMPGYCSLVSRPGRSAKSELWILDKIKNKVKDESNTVQVIFQAYQTSWISQISSRSQS